MKGKEKGGGESWENMSEAEKGKEARLTPEKMGKELPSKDHLNQGDMSKI